MQVSKAIKSSQVGTSIAYPDIAIIVLAQPSHPAIPKSLRLGVILKCLSVESAQAVPGTAPYIAPAVFEQ